jgi:carotenoid cleavage dioxygenase-like enzyme
MSSSIVNTIHSTLPVDDDHPYRTGAWRPNHHEWDADDLVVEGEIPSDLNGVYLRNTENPIHPSIAETSATPARENASVLARRTWGITYWSSAER